MFENFTQLTADNQHLIETFGVIDMTARKKTGIEKTLSERGSNYGDFNDHAQITQNIKRAMVNGRNWPLLSDAQKEALEMVAHKIGRIVNGDPNYKDSWVDIEGYVHLVSQELPEEVV